MTREEQVRRIMEGMESGKYYFKDGVFKLCDDYTKDGRTVCKGCQFYDDWGDCVVGTEGALEAIIDMEPFMKRFPEQFI